MIIYIKSFTNDKYGKFLVLSDDTKQIIFKDKISILISNKKETVGFIDSQKKVSFIPLINAMRNSSKVLRERLKYIKKTNFREIKNKIQQKINNNKTQNSEKDEELNYDENEEY